MIEEEKKEKRKQILIGVGITAVSYGLVYLSLRYYRFFWDLLGSNMSWILAIYYLGIAAGLVAIGVLTSRKGKPYIGKTIGILFAATPVIALLLLLGTCGVALSGL